MPKKLISIITLGCKSNQYDETASEELLRASGYDTTNKMVKADGYVINTCTVTNATDSQNRNAMRRARRLNKDAVIIVTGCYAQVSPQEVSEIDEIDFVLGNGNKDKILEYIEKGRNTGTDKIAVTEGKGTPIDFRASVSTNRTRVNVKVQDGCNRPCTFCIIPKARGRQVSFPLDKVLEEIRNFDVQGTREIVLTGIHIGSYGSDLQPKTNFLNLLKAIEAENLNLRVRVSSIDPDELTDELIDFLKASKTICPHLHVAFQSGDDKILKAMKRPYTSGHCSTQVLKAVKEIPNLSIGTDIIAGFPGETEAEFQNTVDLVKSLPLSYLHVFSYSVRAGTEAEGFSGKVPAEVIKERADKLKAIDSQLRARYLESYIAKDVKVIVERTRHKQSNLLKGVSANYIPVLFEGSDDLKNNVVTVNLKSISDYNNQMVEGKLL